jgi:glycerol-3-phosphate acyltransferase PlsY
MACGFAAITGHVFPVFLQFRGGKGVATGAGVLTALAPLPSLCGFGAFGVALALWRYVSLGSIIACVVLAPAAWLLHAPTEIVVFCGVVGGLVALLHRKNVARIAAGTEPRVFQKKKADDAKDPAQDEDRR